MTSPTAGRTRQKEETRQRLLAAARAAFDEGSVVTTPLDAVARGAGVSKATLFFHFATRADLLRATAGDLYGELALVVDALHEHPTVPYLRAYLLAQTDRRIVLLWKIGDVLAADADPLADVAYASLAVEVARRLGVDGVAADRVDDLAGVIAPAAFMVARRVAFGSAEEAEVDAFLAHVASLLPSRQVGSDPT